MAALICDLRREAASLAAEYWALREAGEAVVLYWPAAPAPAEYREVRTAAELHQMWEDEHIAVTRAWRWLPLDEITRAVVVDCDGARELVEQLRGAGCELVERVAASDLTDLGQSWASGRRLPAVER